MNSRTLDTSSPARPSKRGAEPSRTARAKSSPSGRCRFACGLPDDACEPSSARAFEQPAREVSRGLVVVELRREFPAVNVLVVEPGVADGEDGAAAVPGDGQHDAPL